MCISSILNSDWLQLCIVYAECMNMILTQGTKHMFNSHSHFSEHIQNYARSFNQSDYRDLWMRYIVFDSSLLVWIHTVELTHFAYNLCIYKRQIDYYRSINNVQVTDTSKILGYTSCRIWSFGKIYKIPISLVVLNILASFEKINLYS